jgi:hypothetical protein
MKVELKRNQEAWAEWGLDQQNTNEDMSQHWFDVKDHL